MTITMIKRITQIFCYEPVKDIEVIIRRLVRVKSARFH